MLAQCQQTRAQLWANILFLVIGRDQYQAMSSALLDSIHTGTIQHSLNTYATDI